MPSRPASHFGLVAVGLAVSGVLLLGIPASAAAQDPVATAATSRAAADTAEVRAAVVAMFDAMRAADTAAMRAAFLPGAPLISAGYRDGAARLDTANFDDFLASIANAKLRDPDVQLDERLGRTVIEMDDPLASVWTEYEFWVGDRFSHCGVDAIHMLRTADGWRIVQVVDTRRREGCTGH